MRASIGLMAVVLLCAVTLALGGCGKKNKKKKRAAPVEQPVKKDVGPNSCDLRTTKHLCMEYTGANSTAEEIEDNCSGWDEATFIKGNCPAGGLAVCTQVLGPTQIRMIHYEGADMAVEEQACRENGHTWTSLAKPKPSK